MEIKRRSLVAVTGGIFCAVVGSIMGGVVVVLVRIFQERAGDIVGGLTFLPLAIVFASVAAAPFGLIVGSAGSWWLAGRIDHGVSRLRLCLESAGVGAILGATFPLVMSTLGWGPFNNLVSALPISIGIAIVCGITLPIIIGRLLLPPVRVGQL